MSVSLPTSLRGRLSALVETSLRRAVWEYVAHYHTERNHQGLDNAIIEPETIGKGSGPIRCRERLGGMLRDFHRHAA